MLCTDYSIFALIVYFSLFALLDSFYLNLDITLGYFSLKKLLDGVLKGAR